MAQWAKKQCINPAKRKLTHYSTFKNVPVSFTVPGMEPSSDCVYSDGDVTLGTVTLV